MKSYDQSKAVPVLTAGTNLKRRMFMQHAAALAGTSALARYAAHVHAEGPLETTKIRIVISPALCFAPQYVADAMLKAEGFTEVEYIEAKDQPSQPIVVAGDGDFTIDAIRSAIITIDNGGELVLLSGIHLGCYELFATEGIRKIRDLKGRRVGVYAMGSDSHVFLASMAAYVGLDPKRDIQWVAQPAADSMRDLQHGKIDAYLAFPPEPQQLRAKNIGHVIVNTATDRPWSQYFCCMLIGNRGFVEQHPVATKRTLRAMLKATDLCAREPDKAARLIVDKGYASNYQLMREILTQVSYNAWRTYDHENTARFFAVQLREVGMIKSSPQKILEKGANWRFLNELKQELKA